MGIFFHKYKKLKNEVAIKVRLLGSCDELTDVNSAQLLFEQLRQSVK